MIEHLLIQSYEIPLRRPWASARGGFERRRGLLLRIDAEGLRGFGDCAPLPEAGTETLATAEQVLRALHPRLIGRGVQDRLTGLEGDLSQTPAARFALECALLDLASQHAGISLRRQLAADALDEVRVNAMAGPLAAFTPECAQRLGAQGFDVVKLKLGLQPPEAEQPRLRALAAGLPTGLKVRLDANGAWSFAEARQMLAALADLPIESIEEPLRRPTTDQLRVLQTSVPFPLARDESLPTRLEGAALDAEGLGVRRIVLKPAVIGGLDRACALAREAMASGIEVVVTSLVESAAGLWPTVQLAAATRSPLPHGLATADWLAEDLGAAPRPVQGRISLGDAPGSGFRPGS